MTLIDKVPYHCFKTEYYALVAGTISETHIRIPFPEHPRLNIQYGTVTNIDLEEKAVHLDGGEAIQYDDLIIDLAVRINTITFLGRRNIHIAYNRLNKHVRHMNN